MARSWLCRLRATVLVLTYVHVAVSPVALSFAPPAVEHVTASASFEPIVRLRTDPVPRAQAHNLNIQSCHTTPDDASIVATTADRPTPDDVSLVVGVKTSVVHGFARRQAIRQTWANATVVPHGVRVLFLGCEPDLTIYPSARQQTLRDAIAREKESYEDLLTSELSGCRDSFAGLSDKVKAFLHYAATSFPSLAYAMITDDDVYLRLDRLHELLEDPSTPTTRFFGGNAACTSCRHLGSAVRDPRNKYFLSSDAYPMAQLPPYLSGQHVVLSADLVRFVARNARDFRGLAALDDVALGLWLFALLRIQRTWFDGFQSLRYEASCANDFLSLADLTLAATRHIHANALHGRPPCTNFNRTQWLKDGTRDRDETTTSRLPLLHWDVRHDAARHRLTIALELHVATIALPFTFVPATMSAEDGLCGRAASLLQEKLYLTFDSEVLCTHFGDAIRTHLHEALRAQPALAPLIAIAQHNLRRMQQDDAMDETVASEVTTYVALTERAQFTAVVSPSARSSRVLIECLLVAMHRDKRVLVLDDDEATSLVSRHNSRTRLDLLVVTSLDSVAVIETALARVPRVLMIDEPAMPRTVITDRRVVTLTADRPRDDDHASKTLWIPRASRLFSRTRTFTPRQLLKSPHGTTDATDCTERRGLRIHPDAGMTVDLSALLARLCGLVSIETSAASHTRTGFQLDDDVAALHGAMFAVVVVDGEEGDWSEELLVATFLAGAIPVVVGSSPCNVSDSRRSLFNPRAFIDCRSWAPHSNTTVKSADACADYVLAVITSPALYEQMRREPPITELHKFEEAFSWHPEVVAAMATATQKATGVTAMSERLLALLEDNPPDTK